jgi:hypothetical protein
MEEAVEVAGQAQRRLTGTQGQIAWAEQIRASVNREFDRVASALEARGPGRATSERTVVALVVLEEKRAEVMAREEAGYFIREWQELRDQVRLMIIHDPRYNAVTPDRAAVAEWIEPQR